MHTHAAHTCTHVRARLLTYVHTCTHVRTRVHTRTHTCSHNSRTSLTCARTHAPHSLALVAHGHTHTQHTHTTHAHITPAADIFGDLASASTNSNSNTKAVHPAADPFGGFGDDLFGPAPSAGRGGGGANPFGMGNTAVVSFCMASAVACAGVCVLHVA